MDAVLDAYFSGISWISGQIDLRSIDDAAGRFLIALFLTVVLLGAVATGLHLLPRFLATQIRAGSLRLAYGGSTENVRRLEMYSGVIFRRLVRFSLLWARSSYGTPEARTARLPPRDENRWRHAAVCILRLLILFVGGIASAVRFIGVALTTVYGAAAIVLAVSLAFPAETRFAVLAVLNMADDAVRTAAEIELSPLAMLTALSAAIAVAVLTAKLIRSDRMLAKRRYRQDREVEAIGLLREFLPLVGTLADAIDADVVRHVRARDHEYRNLERWHREMTSAKGSRPRARTVNGAHLRCTAECVDTLDPLEDSPELSPDVRAALSAIETETELVRALNARRSEFARLLSTAAWQGYTEFFLTSGLPAGRSISARVHVSSTELWGRRRIEEQHDILRYLTPEERDLLAEGRPLTGISVPSRTWCAQELARECWWSFEASRHMHQLVDHGNRLLGSTRIEKMLAKITAA